MNNELLKERVESLHPFLIETRRDIHAHPERGFLEKRTSAKIIEILSDYKGIEITGGLVGGTGVMATIRGKYVGPTIMLRVDIDCVLTQDKKDVPYCSQNDGLCHACGHDIYTTVGLGTAIILSELRDSLHGTAKVFFQPSEDFPCIPDEYLPIDVFTEKPDFPRAGGMAVDEGILEGTDRLLGMHCWPQLRVGKIGYEPWAAMAGSANFHIAVLGKSGHAATPELTIDPIPIAAQIILGLQTIISRKKKASTPLVLTIGTIRGGSRRSVIGDRVDMTGTVRGFENDYMRNEVGSMFENMIRGICEANGASYICDYALNLPAVINDQTVIRDSVSSLKDLMGEDNVVELKDMPLTAEDFSYLSACVPALYMKLGVSNEEPRTQYALHNSFFDVDESCLSYGVCGVVKIITDYLGA